MNAVLSLFKKSNASSAELRALESDLQAELEAADIRLSELERSRRTLLIEGTPKQVADLDNEMASVRYTAERATVMIEDLQPRIKAADQAENARAIEERVVTMQATARKMRDHSLKIHDHLVALNQMVHEGKRMAEDLKAGNAFLREHDCGNLKVDHPILKAAQSIGRDPLSFPAYLFFEFPIHSHPDSKLIVQAIRDLELAQ